MSDKAATPPAPEAKPNINGSLEVDLQPIQPGGPAEAGETDDASLEKLLEGGEVAPAEVETPEAETAEEPGTEEALEAVDLGEFDASNAETLEKFNAHFFTEDNQFRMEAVEAEWLANFNEDTGTGDINPGTRDYLKHQMGLSDQAIDDIIASKTALRNQSAKASADAEAEFYGIVGGEAAYGAKLAWAAGEGGYTPAQKERFNAALKAGGEEAREQLELLNMRAEKAGVAAASEEPTKQSQGRQRPGAPGARTKRPASPAKTTSASASAGGGGGGTGYATEDDYHADLKAAKGDAVKTAAVNKKLERSTFR